MRNIVWFFLILLVCCKQANRECQDISLEYSKLISKEIDPLGRINFLNGYLLKNPFCKDAYLLRGDLFLERDSLNEARRDFEKVIAIDNNNVYALYKKGFIHSLADEEDSAIVYYNRALELKKYKSTVIDYPDDPGFEGSQHKYDIDYYQLLYRLGESYYYKTDLPNALRNFTACIDGNYLLDKSYLYRATIYLGLKKTKEACEDLTESINLGNKDATQYYSKHCK